MGKKKPFVDRKTAAVYHVVRRSQRDVGTEATASELTDFVLMPSPDNARRAEAKAEARAEAGGRTAAARDDAAAGASAKPANYGAPSKTTSFDALKSHLASAGMLDAQSATYAKYTKPIQPGGKFISSTDAAHIPTEDAANLDALFTDTSKNELDEALREAMEVNEVGRMLDSIALNADCMEDDVAKALFDFEEGEFEEILDDFCITADQEQLETDDADGDGGGNGGSDEFDYEKHIQALMAKARAQDAGEMYEAGRELEDEFFAGRTPLHGKIDEEDDADDFDYDRYGEEEEEDSLDREFNGQSDSSAAAAVAKVGDEQQRILCQKFEEALLEYDSDDVGDLDEECEEIVGDRPLEGDAQLEAALNEFLTEKEDEVLFEGTHKKEGRTKRAGGSGYAALVGKTMVNAGELDESQALLVNIEESKKQMQKDLAEADAILANPEMDLPPEEVFIDGKSYFSQSSRNPWDCESILSTYSNLDNNPAVIGRTKKKKKGKKTRVADSAGDAIPEEGPAKIRLSNKTGLPLGAFDRPSLEEEYDEYCEDDTQVSVNLGAARDKNESKLEKKQRKMAIKEERKICRMQKKILKEAFGEEFQRRGRAEVADAVGGSSVFRFS
ncbi:hypothetical protein ACHAXT_012906 [Thalassiosira profunda]